MIAGFGGELISHAFVEDRLLPAVDRSRIPDFERRLIRWWQAVSRTLGPASSARAIQDVAAMPLLQLLEYERPSSVASGTVLTALLPAASCVLICVPWARSTSAARREAVCHALESGAAWALICNGRSLRIVDATRAWTRSAIEFDFARLTSSPGGVATLWMLARGLRMSSAEQGLRAHVEASDAHASRVCRTLSDGVLSALTQLGSAFTPRPRHRHHEAALDQSLTVVYRILFLLFAEARSLVPVWNDIYRSAYSIETLTNRAARPAPAGLWEAFQAISRLAHAGCDAGDLAVTAFNGRLFSPRHTPLAEHRRIPDGVVRDVLLSLSTERTRAGRRRISYHDLGVEQLGSVYERVLDYRPSRANGVFALERTSTQRKSSGSFYTPQPLTEFLVRRTLAPLVSGKTADQILQLRIVDPAMGSGAFLVAAGRYLADACEHAMGRDGQWPEGELPRAARATLRRAVAERCLYGVDLNPTAVQLARLSLWLTTLAADRPLTFLDHHLATGNSLVGAWLSDLSRPPSGKARRPVTLTLFDEAIADDLAARVLPERIRMAIESSDSLEAVRRKERSLAALAHADGPLSRWKSAADAWCASPLTEGPQPPAALVAETIAAATGGATTLPARQLAAALRDARTIAARHAAFHWELEFPEVFVDHDARVSERGGFDAVIGNPPWEMLRADTGSSLDRDASRSVTVPALRFFRQAYSTQGAGHPNAYQLFVERALRLVRPGGRIGFLLPSGVATDHGSSALRRRLLERTSIDTWIGFDNRKRIFPIHRSVRFVLLSTTNGGTTDVLRFRCGVTDPAVLHADDGGAASVTLSRSRIEAMSPDQLTIPEVTGPIALSILTGISQRVPALADARGWNVRFGRELNATDDRSHFSPLAARLLPIVEGKQLSPFQVDVSRSRLGITRAAAATLVDPSITFDRERIAYRDVASATNKLTLIAAMLPKNVISTHTVFCLKTPLADDERWCLLGLMNTLVANYLVRLQVTTHVTTALMARLPVPRPTGTELNRIALLSRSLAGSGWREPDDSYALLNATAAQLYGISEDEYAVIVESFPLVTHAQRDACLRAHARATEARRHGGYGGM